MKKIYLILTLVLGMQGFASAQYVCGDSFYDSGGAGADYSVDEIDTIIFCPSTLGDIAQLTFTAFDIEDGWDYLTIYDGNDVSGNLIGAFTGTTIPSIITAENPSGCLTVVFESDNIIAGPGWEAVFNCIPAPTCLRPSQLMNSASTDVSTVLSWTANSGETAWEIEYGPVGFSLGTGTTVVANSNPYTLTGLMGLTTYQVYIRANCGGGDISTITGPIAFTTTATPLFCGDVFVDSGSDTGDYQNGENYTQVICPNDASTQAVQLIFTEFDTEQCCDVMTIYDGNDITATEIGAFRGTTSPGTITAENPSGCLTVNFFSDGSVVGTGWLASVNCVAPITCFRPTNLNTDALTHESATISWTSNGSETEWIVEYGVTGFTPGSGTIVTTSDNPYTITGLTDATAFQVYVTASCSPTDMSSVQGPVAFTTLLAPLPPFICGNLFTDAGGVNLNYANSVNETTTICPNDASTEAIQLVFTAFETEANYDFLTIYDGNDITGTQVGIYDGTNSPGTITAENSTGCLTINFTSDGSVNRAGWIADINCVAPITCFRPTNITLDSVSDNSATLSWTANSGETSWSIEYGPAGFAPGTGTTVSSTTNPHTILGLTELTNYSFYVSANCGGGDMSNAQGPFNFTTTMAPLPPLECGSVFVDGGGANGNYANSLNETTVICPSGPNQAVSLVFTAFGTENCCDSLTIYNGNGTTGTILGSYRGTATPGTITSTSPDGCLTAVFFSDGSVTGLGWNANIVCNSTFVCNPPSNPTFTSTTHNTATLAWTNGGTETAWSIEYGPIGFTPGSGTIVPATSNPFTLTGLTESTGYEYYVNAFCSPTDISLYAGPAVFATGVNSINGVEINTLSIQPNPTKGKFVIKNLAGFEVKGELFDVQGRSLNINSSIVANNEITLDISNFENGVYFFKTTSELGNKTFSIVKN